jgi:putative nucleotidyltransferase with HDIG domain
MLSKLFGSKSKRNDESPPLAAGLKESIVSYLGVKSLPIMPKVAQQAFQLATSPNAEPEDYIAVVERDEGLSARVIKIANSVYYSRGTESKTISDAVTVIGVTELQCLMNATALSNFFPSRHALRATFWAHDVAVAITARLLAQTIRPNQADMAFLGGLMHDIGKLFMLQQHTANYEKVVAHGFEEGLETINGETLEYPFDHTQVGHLIAEKWHFTPELTACISRHHKPWNEIPKDSVVALVKTANILVHTLALGAGREANQARRIYEPMLPEAWEHLGIAESLRAEILKRAASTFEQEHSLYESWSNG